MHSFWVPQLAGKTDLIPNRTNTMWIEPRVPGQYRGQCAEFCGTQHAHMLLTVYVHSRPDFDAWVATQRAPAVDDPAVAAGRRVFERTACVDCHAVRGANAAGRFGPDLTHLMSRDTLGAGAAPLTFETLDAWIADPDDVKPGVLMPALQLEAADRAALVRYLASVDGDRQQATASCCHGGRRRAPWRSPPHWPRGPRSSSGGLPGRGLRQLQR